MLDPAPAEPPGVILVLGGGIAGLAAADRLSRAGWRVRVIERAPLAGGMHQAYTIGGYTFDAGSIFYEENAALFDLAPGLRDMCPSVSRRQRRIAPDGSLRHYPFEPRELRGQSVLALVRMLIDLLWSRLAVPRDGTLDAIARKRLGRRLFEQTGLAAYITRFHHVSPREIDETFFFHRMAFVARASRLRNLIPFLLRTRTRPRPSLRVRPHEGFAPLFNSIVKRLAAQGVAFRFGEELLSLQREGRLFLVRTTSGICRVEAVVSTIPLDSLHRALFGTSSGLVSLDMTTLFLSAASLDSRLGNVLYNFHGSGEWKRATIYSRIYATPQTDREFLAVETTIPPGGHHDPQRAFEAFRAHMNSLGLASDLRLEGNVRVETCYPLYRHGSSGTIARVIERISRTGIVLAGRQGRFEYLPTSSGVIRRVVEELDAAALPAFQSSPAT